MLNFKWSVFLLLGISGCIGTDYEDDPKDPGILVDKKSVSVRVGGTSQVEATYWYNSFKEDPSVTLIWQSKQTEIASVDQTGQITGVSKGQTEVIVYAPREDTVTIPVSVVESTNEVAKVEISSVKTTFNIGETIQLNAKAYTVDDVEIQNANVSWISSDETIVSINSSGLATAKANGTAAITAQVDNVTSQPYVLSVGAQMRTGMFQGSGSYKALGVATLIASNGNLTLEFSSDFETSFALGTFVYLANSTSGTTVRSQGFEIAQVTTNGAHSYDISALDPNITLDQYQYVILLCKPASITFGYAELK